MKQIVLNTPKKEIILVDDISTLTNIYSIVAYAPAEEPHNLAIYVQATSYNKLRYNGFIYFTRLLKGIIKDPQYVSHSRNECIVNALNAGHTVFWFENQKQFLNYITTLQDN